MPEPEPILTRRWFQELALERLKDAETLLKAQCWSGAYYLAGYVIECALKAAIAKQTREFDFPDKRKVIHSYSHDLRQLVNITDINEEKLLSEVKQSWLIVTYWSENSRYELKDKQQAEELYFAVADAREGVFPWLKARW